ncbi:MAG: hypothetical protein M5U01_18270 [Ardenticatenaceae bacterium]|nr:hypothetical protein [Ardenticatenaceae bacterium]
MGDGGAGDSGFALLARGDVFLAGTAGETPVFDHLSPGAGHDQVVALRVAGGCAWSGGLPEQRSHRGCAGGNMVR